MVSDGEIISFEDTNRGQLAQEVAVLVFPPTMKTLYTSATDNNTHSIFFNLRATKDIKLTSLNSSFYHNGNGMTPITAWTSDSTFANKVTSSSEWNQIATVMVEKHQQYQSFTIPLEVVLKANTQIGFYLYSPKELRMCNSSSGGGSDDCLQISPEGYQHHGAAPFLPGPSTGRGFTFSGSFQYHELDVA